MKKPYQYAIALGLILLSGCSSRKPIPTAEFQVTTGNVEGNVPALERDILDHQCNVELANIPRSDIEGVDIDLTEMSSAMVYAIVYQMLFFPEEYIGLTIRMTGDFFVWENPQTQKEHYTTIVEDALACCQQGLEFVLAEGSYPEDYPAIDSRNTVVGELAVYAEEGYENIHLINAYIE